MFLCLSCGPDNDFQDVEDRIEQDVLTRFLAGGAEVEEKEHAGEISRAVSNELSAFYSRQASHGRGAPIQKRIHNYKPPASELTIDQRRQKLKTAKENSPCLICGQSGNWYADIDKATGKSKCQKRKNDTPNEKTANVAKKLVGADLKHKSITFQSRGRPTAMMAIPGANITVSECS